MERQKRKLKGIADLYNIEDERQRRQQPLEEDVSPPDITRQNTSDQTTSAFTSVRQDISRQNISQQNASNNQQNNTYLPTETPLEPVTVKFESDISKQNISKQNIPTQDIPIQDIPIQDITSPATWSSNLIDPARGYFPVFNDVTDRLIRELKLDVYEQAILFKMYRDSRGWKSDECEVSHAEIVRSCNMSKSQSQRTLAKLTARGLIVNLGRAKSGPERNRFKVLPGVPIIPSRNIFREDISREGQNVSLENIVLGQDISPANTNKNNNKDSLNTHTQPGVGVGSKFTIEECRRYAEHLHSTGQGINNPGGYATTIHRTGEADALIESFLHPEPVSAPSDFDVSQCPDCQGTGFYYPQGVEAGVARCKHERLAKERE